MSSALGVSANGRNRPRQAVVEHPVARLLVGHALVRVASSPQLTLLAPIVAHQIRTSPGYADCICVADDR